MDSEEEEYYNGSYDDESSDEEWDDGEYVIEDVEDDGWWDYVEQVQQEQEEALRQEREQYQQDHATWREEENRDKDVRYLVEALGPRDQLRWAVRQMRQITQGGILQEKWRRDLDRMCACIPSLSRVQRSYSYWYMLSHQAERVGEPPPPLPRRMRKAKPPPCDQCGSPVMDGLISMGDANHCLRLDCAMKRNVLEDEYPWMPFEVVQA